MNTACTCGLYVSLRFVGVTSNSVHTWLCLLCVLSVPGELVKLIIQNKHALIQNIQFTMGSSLASYMYCKLGWIIMLVVSVNI